MRKWNWLLWPFGIYLTVFLCLAVPILINPGAYRNYSPTCTIELAACAHINWNPSVGLLAVLSLPLSFIAGMFISLAFAIKRFIRHKPKTYKIDRPKSP
jgi:hypothetical protein